MPCFGRYPIDSAATIARNAKDCVEGNGMNRIILTVAMFICAAAVSVALVPSLWSDLRLRNQELVVSKSSFIDEATCKTRLVVSFCQITTRGGGFPTFYMIAGLGSDEKINIMVPKAIPGARNVNSNGEVSPAGQQGFTTNIGVSYFMNRLATYLAALGVSLGLALAAMMGWIRGL
jgi:hypothetical protein